MTRPRTPVGSYGTISTTEIQPGKWRARTYFRFSNGELKRVQKFGSSKPKAENALKRHLKTVDAGLTSSMSPNTRISALADRFIEEKKLRLAPGSIQNYQNTIDAHIKPGLGGLSIHEAGTVERLGLFIDGIAKNNGHGAAKSCRSVLSGMMALAVRNGALPSNPVRDVEGIKKPGKSGSKPIPPERLGAFLKAVAANEKMKRRDLVDLFELMAGTGFRMGETCGLQWSAIDFDKNTIAVERQAKALKEKGVTLQEFPKTHASARIIEAPKAIMALLKRRYDERRSDLVFPTADGTIRDPNNVERALREERDAMKFPDVTSHSLRKCVATMLDMAGMSARDVADYLGHRRPSMTMDVYMQRSRSTGVSASKINTVLSDIIQ